MPLSSYSSLVTAGTQAAAIGRLWNLTLGLCVVVFSAVLLAVFWGLLRASRNTRDGVPNNATSSSTHLTDVEHPTASRVVIGAAMATALALSGLVVADIATDHALSRLPVADAIHIRLTASQFWWKAEYAENGSSPGIAVANELHIPVGTTIVISLATTDVIHSFWVPSLHGKKDMLPGIATTIVFRADHAGAYRGQCAQFCGPEHALMALLVIADTPQQYVNWREHQQQPAESAFTTALASEGAQVFSRAGCASCHTVRGANAAGTLGPDLTHVMSRVTLAAGSLPNTRPNLEAWIRDPGAVKPGTTMPKVPLSQHDLAAVTAWLSTLN